jgi:hypothetical protein
MGEDTVGDGYQLGNKQGTTADGITTQGVTTHVDIPSLEQAVPWLEGLNHYIQDHLIQDVGKMALSGEQSKLYFGDLDSAQGLASKHKQYVDTVVNSYRDVAKSLDAASQATKDIVKNYKDAEHNNALTAAEVDKSFSNTSGSGTSGSSTTQPAGTTQTSSTQTNNGGQSGSTQGGY